MLLLDKAWYGLLGYCPEEYHFCKVVLTQCDDYRFGVSRFTDKPAFVMAGLSKGILHLWEQRLQWLSE